MEEPEYVPDITHLLKKIHAVTLTAKPLDKGGENKHSNYKYSTELDIYNSVRSEMSKVGLVIIPSILSQESKIEEIKQGIKKYLVTCKVEYKIYDSDTGLHVSVIWVGEGEDSASPDKAGYKAQTGAQKYFLMKLFQLGDMTTDPEYDVSPGVQGDVSVSRGGKNVGDGAGTGVTLSGNIAKTREEAIEILRSYAGKLFPETGEGGKFADLIREAVKDITRKKSDSLQDCSLNELKIIIQKMERLSKGNVTLK